MRFISIGEAAKRLKVDPDKIRRCLFTDRKGREYAEVNGIRLTVYRQGLTGKRLFDAAEIAYMLVQDAKRRRLGGA